MFYVVVGVPRGGTSLIAGTLHYLGVNMGDINWAIKEYITFEDRGAEDALHVRPGNYEFITNYIKKRRNEVGPSGAKLFIQEYLLKFGKPPGTFVIRVDRPLEDTAKSTLDRSEGSAYSYFEKLYNLKKTMPYDYLAEYNAFKAFPKEEVLNLVEATGLSPTEEQIGDAIKFVLCNPRDSLVVPNPGIPTRPGEYLRGRGLRTGEHTGSSPRHQPKNIVVGR